MSMNAFEAMADSQMVAAVKRQHARTEKLMAKLVVNSDRDAPMVASALEKKAFEAQQLMRNYERLKREEMRELRSGPFGKEIVSLEQLLDTLEISSASALITYIGKCKWLKNADENTRYKVLGMVSTAIARMRVRAGLPPFDDSLPFSDEQPTAYELIRYELTGVGQWA